MFNLQQFGLSRLFPSLNILLYIKKSLCYYTCSCKQLSKNQVCIILHEINIPFFLTAGVQPWWIQGIRRGCSVGNQETIAYLSVN